MWPMMSFTPCSSQAAIMASTLPMSGAMGFSQMMALGRASAAAITIGAWSWQGVQTLTMSSASCSSMASALV